ncbi:CBS domain-containing protein [Candidatus Woesearchaeota archaeon]|nr:CBS domain-containing protein [Candidatus Woesearchaeota archaeon]
MRSGYKVCDVMTKKPVSIKPETTLLQAARKMATQHVGSLLVKDNGNLIGIITEQDIVRKAIAKDIHHRESTVADIMEQSLVTISPEKDLIDALKLMNSHNIRHVPVMDDQTMVGFLTSKDILKVQPELFEILAETIELRELERKPIDEF